MFKHGNCLTQITKLSEKPLECQWWLDQTFDIAMGAQVAVPGGVRACCFIQNHAFFFLPGFEVAPITAVIWFEVVLISSF